MRGKVDRRARTRPEISAMSCLALLLLSRQSNKAQSAKPQPLTELVCCLHHLKNEELSLGVVPVAHAADAPVRRRRHGDAIGRQHTL